MAEKQSQLLVHFPQGAASNAPAAGKQSQSGGRVPPTCHSERSEESRSGFLRGNKPRFFATLRMTGASMLSGSAEAGEPVSSLRSVHALSEAGGTPLLRGHLHDRSQTRWLSHWVLGSRSHGRGV